MGRRPTSSEVGGLSVGLGLSDGESSDVSDVSASSVASGDSGDDPGDEPGDGLGERLGDGLGDGLDSGTGVEDCALSSPEVLVAGAAWELVAIAGTSLKAREPARHAEASATAPMRREAMVFPRSYVDASCPARVPCTSSVCASPAACKGNCLKNRINGSLC